MKHSLFDHYCYKAENGPVISCTYPVGFNKKPFRKVISAPNTDVARRVYEADFKNGLIREK